RPPRFGELVEPRGKTVVAARRYWDRPRKLHIKRAPLAHLAVKPDLAPQQPAQFLDDRKPKPRAGILASQPVLADRRRALTELFEDRLTSLCRDPDAGIGDGQQSARGIQASGRDRDPAAFGCELDGVGEQVREDLLDLRPVLEHV